MQGRCRDALTVIVFLELTPDSSVGKSRWSALHHFYWLPVNVMTIDLAAQNYNLHDYT